MVADLMGHHVGLSEVPGGTQLLFHVIEKGQVQVDLLVARAVERADGGAGGATGRLHAVGEQYQRGFLILPADALEYLVPGGFGVGQNHADKLAQLLLGGRQWALTLLAHGLSAAQQQRQ